MRSFTGTAPQRGPFYVLTEPLANGSEMREIADKEILALAHLIHSAYKEWKQQ